MSGGIPSDALAITAKLRFVNGLVKRQTADGRNVVFANITDAGSTFLAAAEAASILRWVAIMKSERWLAELLGRALAIRLIDGNAGQPLMMDIGANAGYFGLLAAGLGADVIFFEPQPACHVWIHDSIRANKYERHAHLVRAALGAEAPVGEAARLFLGKIGTNMKDIGCAGGFDIAGRVSAPVNASLDGEDELQDVFAHVRTFWDGDRNWMPSALERVLLHATRTIRFVKVPTHRATNPAHSYVHALCTCLATCAYTLPIRACMADGTCMPDVW